MPRFFFDVICGEERIDDVEGQDLPDLDSARLAGLRIVRETMAEGLFRDEPPQTPVLEIYDSDGQLIERVPPSGEAEEAAGR